MAWTLYDKYRQGIFNGVAPNLGTGGVNVMITTSGYTPNQATHEFKSDITNEVVGTNYIASGFELSGPSITLAAGSLVFDANNLTVSFSAGGFANGKNLVMYHRTGVATSSKLIAFHTEASVFGNTATDLQITFSTVGLVISNR